ncbi:hypothetical protein CCR85_09545 [Rhodothalassium salexigens]|uniref:DUF465 domain-containing protein n=1 Tax=Rhodothalassium salexigens DSM 2132 TaxID=1188247 RepID=A0A4R2PRG7_RHOSA|nr:YdcH family protein [Rhodothalassium salexigens]MBB4210298.1 hypothetical protein [Rhodothalassium salexigens DSM 2132]MBK1639207.1 hypothetical protein [Rhodothalassium salexigens DSM 2132]MBK5911728.1 hypothetical protein [Rhodothalassium salexigens]MBK5920484.1 hypothetical protein [Rhodothalassium salexigens]TCP38462.1 hypothetical protein EV659_101366 [Rhodothalassium salexigens DSM 2132]
MSVHAHMESLRTKHQQIDRALARETARPMPDDAKIAELKRQKLKLKDTLSRLTTH